MTERPDATATTLGAVVVTYRSESVIEGCLSALRRASERHPLVIQVVDNAGPDRSAAIAERLLGPGHVSRLAANRGFAAGVNAGLAALGAFGERPTASAIAIVNPDTRFDPGSLDRLAARLATAEDAGLVAPRVLGEDGRPERSVGRFPTIARERAHALMLDRWFGREGRTTGFPSALAPVEWASGCAWLLRSAAVRSVGPLDEDFFMYFEDVDYCRRLRDAGWQVLAAPEVRIIHALGRGSGATPQVPADGGRSLVHYFEKFHGPEQAARARRWLSLGWRLRLLYRGARALLGDARSRGLAHRYRLALSSLPERS